MKKMGGVLAATALVMASAMPMPMPALAQSCVAINSSEHCNVRLPQSQYLNQLNNGSGPIICTALDAGKVQFDYYQKVGGFPFYLCTDKVDCSSSDPRLTQTIRDRFCS